MKTYRIEVGFKPGVTDNVGKTSKEAIKDILKIELGKEEAVYTSKQFLISGEKLRKVDCEKISKIKNLSFEEIAKTTTENAKKLFNI